MVDGGRKLASTSTVEFHRTPRTRCFTACAHVKNAAVTTGIPDRQSALD
jgi:hypothetical protein